MANEKILIIEDDKDLSEIISRCLKKEQYRVSCAFDGQEGLTAAKELSPELILLDLMLPKVEGNEVCRCLRSFTNAPVIIISAKNEEIDKLLLLGIGADDYLTKPFSLVELIARVKSHLRRYTSFGGAREGRADSDKQEVRTCNEISIDSIRHEVTVCNHKVNLSATEFRLISFLSAHQGQVFSKEQLLNQVWGYNDFIDLNTVTVTIGRLREKLTAGGACYIKTVWGVGYKWEM